MEVRMPLCYRAGTGWYCITSLSDKVAFLVLRQLKTM